MNEWRPLTPEQLARAEDRLRNPRPGSRIEAAKKFGIDLTLLISNLRKTPTQRVREMQDASEAVEQIRRTVRRVPR